MLTIPGGGCYYIYMSIKPYWVMASLISITFFAGIVLTSSLVSADDSVIDEINVLVPVSCSLTGTGMNTHNATILNGNYNSAIGTTTLTAFCNDNEGFAIYAIGYTDDVFGNNVLTSTELGSEHDIETGTAASGANSTWAMKLAAATGTYTPIIAGSTADTLKEQGDPDFTAFQEVPDEYTRVAYRTASTDIGTNATGSVLSTTYQAYVSPTQAAGDYTGQVRYALVHPATGEAPYSGPYLQTFTLSQCAEGATGTGFTARDLRDEKDYTIRYLNSKCWMTQDLDFTGSTLNSETSNIAAEYTTSNPLVISWYDFETDGYSGGNCDTSNGYSYLCFHTPKDTDASYAGGHAGTYYNFAGATAGIISGTSNTATSNYDICPAGWHIPTNNEASAADSVSNYNIFATGEYNGDIFTSHSSRFPELWENDASGDTNRTALGLISRGTYYAINNSGAFPRYRGLHVRCVRTSD